MKENNMFYSLNDNYKEMSDEDLIENFKSGDKNALEYLITRYKDEQIGTCYEINGGEEVSFLDAGFSLDCSLASSSFILE